MQSCLGFLFYTLLEKLLRDLRDVKLLANIAINIIVVVPFMMGVKAVLFYLQACPCTRSKQPGTFKMLSRYLECIGTCMSFLLCVIAFMMLTAACVLASQAGAGGAFLQLFSFTINSHLIAVFTEMMYTLFQFGTGNHSVRISLCNCEVYAYGIWFDQKVEYEGLRKDHHYGYYQLKYLGGIIRVSIKRAIGDDVFTRKFIQNPDNLRSIQLLSRAGQSEKFTIVNQNGLNPMVSDNNSCIDLIIRSSGILIVTFPYI